MSKSVALLVALAFSLVLTGCKQQKPDRYKLVAAENSDSPKKVELEPGKIRVLFATSQGPWEFDLHRIAVDGQPDAPLRLLFRVTNESDDQILSYDKRLEPVARDQFGNEYRPRHSTLGYSRSSRLHPGDYVDETFWFGDFLDHPRLRVEVEIKRGKKRLVWTLTPTVMDIYRKSRK